MADGIYKTYIKRIFDIIVVILSFPFYIPVFLITAILVKWNMGKPVFFKQVRPGLNGKPFTIYKFRTMSDSRDDSGRLLPAKIRITKFGWFLRSTSLDEIPELYNVLKGDMSLVGPRPLLMEYLDRYTPEQARRHEVPPGITGWAQINGRNAITWDEKFKLDIWYVENYSFFLDMKILLLTILKIFKKEGVTPPDSVIMPEFQGYEYKNEKSK